MSTSTASSMVFVSVIVPLRSLLCLASILAGVRGFNFSVGPTRQCDPFTVSWAGGRPPFQVLVIPLGGTIRNISVPTEAFDDDLQRGSYNVQNLGLPQGVQFILSMSDAAGIFAGGTSSLITMGASQSKQECNITDPGTDFFFSLDSPLAQCRSYPFTHYVGAVLPITILVHIPQGQSFVLHPPSTNSFNWIANLTAGTPAAFSVYDAENRIGGTSGIQVVELTDDTSCLNFASSNNSGGETKSSNSGAGSSSNSETVKGLAIGISTGILGIICFSSLLCFCCYRRGRLHRRRSRLTSSFVDLTYDPNGTQMSLPNAQCRPPSPVVSVASTATMAEISSVFQNSRGESYGSSRAPSVGHHTWYRPDPFLIQSPQNGSQPRISKWSIQNQDNTSAPTAPTSIAYPSEVIVHSDLADSAIELPPQYSANRPPLLGLPNSPMQMRASNSV